MSGNCLTGSDMWELLWSIASSSLIFVVFKLFSTYKVETFYAIVVNYLTAFCVGFLFFPRPFALADLPYRPWFWPAVAMGCLFIAVFNLMARTSQTMGVSVASVATKMSLVLPVIAGVLLYGELLSPFKLLGICIALAAVYFASVKGDGRRLGIRTLYLPGLVFLGSGIIDTSIKYLQETRIPDAEFPIFSSFIFGSAALTGALLMLVREPLSHFRPNGRNILGGIALGIPNFFSIYFLLGALQWEGMPSAYLFTLNNVSIVVLTTLLGIALFRERLSRTNWLGIGLGVASILIISLL